MWSRVHCNFWINFSNDNGNMQSMMIYNSNILTSIESSELVSKQNSTVLHFLAVGYEQFISYNGDSSATHLSSATDNDTFECVSDEDNSELDLDDIESLGDVEITLENRCNVENLTK